MVVPKPPSVTVEVLHRIYKLWAGRVLTVFTPFTCQSENYSFGVDCVREGKHTVSHARPELSIR